MNRRTVVWGSIFLWLIMSLSGCRLWGDYEFKGALIEPPLALPDFEMTADDGQPFRLSDLEGKIVLVYFGYTFCPDICPLTMWDVAEAVAELDGWAEQVSVIFISVDPERDTPAVLDRYLTNFDPHFIGLTADWETTQTIMKPYGAYAEKETVSESAAGYLVAHTGRLYLINRQQELLATYPFGFEPEDLRSDLAHLISQNTPVR